MGVSQDVVIGAEANEYTRLTTSRGFVKLAVSEPSRKHDQALRN